MIKPDSLVWCSGHDGGLEGVVDTHGAMIMHDSLLLGAQDMTEALRESLIHMGQ